MIDKLEPRQMLRVSLVAKKLNEVIKLLNDVEMQDESGNAGKHTGQGDREKHKESNKENNKESNQGGSEQPSDIGKVEEGPIEKRLD